MIDQGSETYLMTGCTAPRILSSIDSWVAQLFFLHEAPQPKWEEMQSNFGVYGLYTLAYSSLAPTRALGLSCDWFGVHELNRLLMASV